VNPELLRTIALTMLAVLVAMILAGCAGYCDTIGGLFCPVPKDAYASGVPLSRSPYIMGSFIVNGESDRSGTWPR